MIRLFDWLNELTDGFKTVAVGWELQGGMMRWAKETLDELVSESVMVKGWMGVPLK